MIEVNWKPREDGLEEPEGATAKSAPPKPRSPVRGPAGRGRTSTLPAWMQKSEEPTLAITNGESEEPGAAGRGRGAPSWQRSSELPPAIPHEDRVEEPDLLASVFSERESAQHVDDIERHSRKGKGRKGCRKGKRSRSRSRPRGERDNWQDKGEDRQERWEQEDGWSHRDDWRQRTWGDRSWGEQRWKRDSWNASRQGDGEWTEIEQVCFKHNIERSWDRLFEDPKSGNWICRSPHECVVTLELELLRSRARCRPVSEPGDVKISGGPDSACFAHPGANPKRGDWSKAKDREWCASDRRVPPPAPPPPPPCPGWGQRRSHAAPCPGPALPCASAEARSVVVDPSDL